MTTASPKQEYRMPRKQIYGRRTFLTRITAASGTVTLLAGCNGNSASDGNSGTKTFGGWLKDVSNYSGVDDRTDKSSVTVEVGAEGNGGAYAFAPAAVRIATGTTVTWKWTGNGGSHNVVAEDDSFKSKMATEAGHTFKYTFESAGTYKYACIPHKSMGMKGVVVVE